MSVALLGASGRLGRMVRASWPQVRPFGRSATPSDLAGCHVLIDLRGIVNGRGDVNENVAIARSALQLGRAAQVSRVFLASSAAVYETLTDELHEDRAGPKSPYAKSKHAMERMAADHPQPSTCLRIGNVAGADAILGGWRPGFKIDQFPDGKTPERTYIGPRSFGLVMKALAGVPDLPPVLNFAAPGLVQMGSLLDAAGLAWTPQPAPATAIKRVALDMRRLQSFVPFSPEACSVDGIAAEWQMMKDRL